LFFLILLAGLISYQDYGISWDEFFDMDRGIVNYNYVFSGDQTLLSYHSRDYGSFFELFLIILDRTEGFQDFTHSFLLRHFVNFLLFYCSLLFFFLLCKDHFGDWRVGLFGVIMLFLSPRIFADSFYNTKDIPFMSFCIISVYTLRKLAKEQNLRTIVAHALASAMAIDLRVAGVLIPAITLVLLRRKASGTIKTTLSYLLLLGFFTVLLWPTLWSNPLENFRTSFISMSNFRADGEVKYLGSYVNVKDLPWHYIPIWIGITTPPLYLVGFVFGLFALVGEINYARLSSKYDALEDDFIFFMWTVTPVLAVILLKSTLYGGWRHLYFIYPAVIILSLKGGLLLLKHLKIHLQDKTYDIITVIMGALVVVSTLNTAIWIVNNHPYENVYFNSITALFGPASNNFDLDYWGLSYRQGLEHILKNDNAEKIPVFMVNHHLSGGSNILILPPEQLRRIALIKYADASKYYVTNFQGRENEKLAPFSELEFHTPENMTLRFNLVYSIDVDDVRILGVYKRV
jgi:hypothetical protein